MAKYAIGLDVGGTKIHAIIAEWDKDFLDTRKTPKIIQSRRIAVQSKKSAERFFSEITGEISRLIKEFGKNDIARVGVGIAGPLSRDKVILNPLNLPFKNFPILKNLKEKFGPRVYVDNDANCFAWAEHLFGAAAAASSSVGITLGTGLGGGIVLDLNGESILYDGYHGSAGEVGHMIIDGKKTFEELCSSRARHLWKDGNALRVQRLAESGDKKAQEAYKEYGFWLGVGIANIINTLNPQIIVIGGSISKAWEFFEEDMRASRERYIISPLAKKTKIVRAKLGDDAGALGAAYLL